MVASGPAASRRGISRRARRTAYWREAETSYERALALAPNEETYLLAAGFQSLANGDAARRNRWYTHAAEVVPNSADAYAGLAWTAAGVPRLRARSRRARPARARSAPQRPGAGERDPVDAPPRAALSRCTPVTPRRHAA